MLLDTRTRTCRQRSRSELFDREEKEWRLDRSLLRNGVKTGAQTEFHTPLTSGGKCFDWVSTIFDFAPTNRHESRNSNQTYLDVDQTLANVDSRSGLWFSGCFIRILFVTFEYSRTRNIEIKRRIFRDRVTHFCVATFPAGTLVFDGNSSSRRPRSFCSGILNTYSLSRIRTGFCQAISVFAYYLNSVLLSRQVVSGVWIFVCTSITYIQLSTRLLLPCRSVSVSRFGVAYRLPD